MAVSMMFGTLIALSPAPAGATTEPGVQATPYNQEGEWWETDGCSLSPESGYYNGATFDFHHACVHHDGCYANKWADKNTCNWWFLNDMTASCAAMHGWVSWEFAECRAIAQIYYTAVYWGGGRAYGESSPLIPIYVAL